MAGPLRAPLSKASANYIIQEIAPDLGDAPLFGHCKCRPVLEPGHCNVQCRRLYNIVSALECITRRPGMPRETGIPLCYVAYQSILARLCFEHRTCASTVQHSKFVANRTTPLKQTDADSSTASQTHSDSPALKPTQQQQACPQPTSI